MASNDQWPPVASTGKGTAKINGNKRNIKDSQQKILSVVNEMFGSALEAEVILTVVQNCNWELGPSIDGLITLTETVENPLVWNHEDKSQSIACSASALVHSKHSFGLMGGSEEVLKTEASPEACEASLPSKWDKPKKGGSKNRMDSFCGNIAKLKSSSESNMSSSTESISVKFEQKRETSVSTEDDRLLNEIHDYGSSGVQKISNESPKLINFEDFTGVLPGGQAAGIFPTADAVWPPRNQRTSRGNCSSPPMMMETHKKQNFQDAKAAAEDKEFNQERTKHGASLDSSKMGARKPESESLCGLKVQYRMSGMENSSDDDADVVIEGEASDYKINPAPPASINVSQFLSPPTQTAPRRTQPELHTKSTPSPPRTLQRNAHETALSRIKSTIQKGHKIMVLLRGLPGSGKSTLAKSIVASTVGGNPAPYIFNTDDFFVTLGRGTYQYDSTRLQDAHNTNHKRVWNAVKMGRSPVIVDNTNTECWEMRPYAAMAVENGYIVEILEPNTPWAQNVNELAKKNTHNVPKSKIREKAKRYERLTNAKYLLEKYALKYSPENNPPQLRTVPEFVENVRKDKTSPFTIADIQSNWGSHDRNNFILSSHDIESMQNIDETHSAMGVISERASIATDSSESSSNPEKAANFREETYSDYLSGLQDSDDESFEMLDGSSSEHLSDIVAKSADNKETSSSHRSLASAKLSPEENGEESAAAEPKLDSSPMGSQQIFGAIGSERKGSLSVGSGVGNPEIEKSETKKLSPSVSQQALGAIGSERKGSLSVSSAVGNTENEKTETKKLSSNDSQQALGAIGSERKGSLSIGSGVGNPENKEAKTKNVSPSGSQQALGAIGSERKGSSSVGSSVGNLASDKSETKDSNGVQSSLGAIGSERKGNLPVTSSVGKPAENEAEKPRNNELAREDNVLGQCWDFTLILGRIRIHSTHSRHDLPSRLVEKPKFKDPEASVEVSADKDEIVDEKADNNFNSFWNVEALLNENIPENPEPQRSVVDSLNDDSFSVDEKQENLVKECLEHENEATNDETPMDENAIDTREAEEKGGKLATEIESPDLCDSLTSENRADKRLHDPLGVKIEEATEVTEEVATEVSESTPKVSTAFGTFLNMLKTSILGGGEETSSNDFKDENPDRTVSLKCETSVASPSSSENQDFDQGEETSNDVVDFPGVLDKSSEAGCSIENAPNASSEATDQSCDKVEKIYPDLSTNPFREEMMQSQEEKSGHDDAADLITDNINSISWKESPFPIDGAKIPVLPPFEDNKSVQTADAFTNTTYYDFNVAYVGGTSETGYRELSPVSRSINEGASVAKSELRPPLKLMLDKSSMTNEANILATEPNLNVEKEKDSSDRIQELVELFPNIPIDSLTAFYNQECKGNFDWAVEVLLEDVPTGFTIEGLENRRSINLETDDSSSTGADSEKKSNVVPGRLKQRSHSSSPRHRRKRSKDFRSFSMEYPEEDSILASGESALEENVPVVNKDKEEVVMESFYKEAASDTFLSLAIREIAEASSTSSAARLAENEDIELDFGREFINQLEKTFGNTDFTFPDEFKPVIRIKKSMAEELHGLWIQSMYDQLNERHAKLDKMIAKDEEMARALDREETVQPTSEPVVPNLEEIMDMEMALASYKNELKEKIARETPNDMASRLSRQMLCESLPDIDPQTLSEILKAHDGNFKETCETIETSTGRTISKSDTLKKQQSLLDRVKEERKNREISENMEDTPAPLIVVKPDVYPAAKAEKLGYNAAVARGQDARKEAQKQFSLRIENFNKAAEAYRKGYPGVAAYYSQMAKLHSDNIEAAHAEAADAFVSAQIYYTDDENTLDLHNLFVPEALLALDRFLELQSKKLGKSNKRSSTLYIITGRGARSNNGLSKIKPAVSKKLISKNIRFTEANAGCLKVTLSKKNGILE